ncbi:WD40/YVTN/BNR-like repeat-containing protein [Tunicatimonas pelagia]|uniref:WD40/YVTN/BNR-like repeat-containing protein n=1 Tax=Tunicatimonas pelagia TaxID=931531 RepID=UPI0026651ACB|nr:glycosyl hydrolase [Tunicatimonas pelagia]WKN43376.1 glycosyl hydrolase [Tunicatimonas pelagia]
MNQPRLLFLLTLAFYYLCVLDATAQRKKKQLATTVSYDDSLYNAIQYRLVGPFRGGRSCTVTGIPNDRDTYYFGSVGGGVWKTSDGGTTWKNISDGFFGGSVGSIAVSESDPNVIYVGLGEKTIRGNVSSNFGVWKSTDAGTSWNFIGLKNTRHIGRIRVHPTNPDVVYVAAMGDLWQSSEERGVYKSTDGGETWNKILFANVNAGAVDLVLDPNNPRILYASTWNVHRTPYSLSSGGPGSDLWKSTDSGKNWEKLTEKENMPDSPRGIIGVTVSPANSDRIWALIEAEDGGVFRSDDAGKTWKKINSDRALRSRAWYYTRIIADSQDENKVYVMNVSYAKSTDGGKTFTLHRAPHGDHHDLWIDPSDNTRMIIADDGGAQVSTDGGDSWTTYYNQPTAQFYRIATDNHFPYRIYGAQQDNSSIRIAHRSDGPAITEDNWEVTAGGESAYHAIDPEDNEIIYGGNYKGYLYRFNHENNQRRSINVWPLNPAGSGVEVMKYRFNWNFPTFFSHHNPDKLYAFSHRVHVSNTEGENWETISPDLTRAVPETMVSSGGPITQDNTGVEFYATILTANESPYQEGELWTGSDDGLLHLTQDDGSTWQDITPADAPTDIMWNSIDIHPTVRGGAYVAGTRYKSGDFQPYLYKTTDYGQSWTKITSGIDDLHFTRVVHADPKREGLLYAGTEYGMYVSFDDGANWKPFQLNLPEVPITDLQVRDNNLIVATQGRSFWMIDDLTPLHQLNETVARADFHLYQPKPSYRMKQQGWDRYNALLHGKNHPEGVMIYYHLQDGLDTTDIISLEILEEDGDVIKTFASNSKKPQQKLRAKKGSNLFVWDMRYPDAVSFKGLILYSSNTDGPQAVPGKYTARLTLNGESQEQPFEILKDPRVKSTQEDLQAQFNFLIDVRDKLSEAHQAVIDIRNLRKDLDYVKAKLKDNPNSKTILKATQELNDEMTIIENNIHETRNEAYQDPLNFGIKLNNRLAYLATHESAGEFRPTEQAVAYKKEVSAQIDGEIMALQNLLNERLPVINQMMEEQNIEVLTQPKSENNEVEVGY